MAKTLFEKIWEAHVVTAVNDGPSVIYIDKHLIHEVTSPQAFEGIEKRGLSIFRKQNIVATADHNVPTINQHLPIKEQLSKFQVDKLTENCNRHQIPLYGLGHEYQGIVHVIGPELGFTLPGMTIVCGDSHTSTHGAFGSIAFGIGTSEVEQVFATQCLLQNKPKTMKIELKGRVGKGVSAKDLVLYIISRLGAGGATGYFIEFCGEAIKSLSMEERMTVCNMSIEMGARGGLIAPDEITFTYLKDKRYCPKGEHWEAALSYWKTLYSDAAATFDKEIIIDVSALAPMITYGTNPGMGITVTGSIPQEGELKNAAEAASFIKSLNYMGFKPGEAVLGKKINYVFIGSCTNSRIEDLREAAKIIKGKKKANHVHAFVVPGSQLVRKKAISEGLDKIFEDAGFEFREPGCSACLGMNEDKIPAGEYCVSTSNRNFEGRQGAGARTLLASPLTAAACAITGEISDVRTLLN